MKITDFRLGEIPYLAIDRLTTLKVYDADRGFKTPLFNEDWRPCHYLQDSIAMAKTDPDICMTLVYFYPEYIDHLYERAMLDLKWRGYFRPKFLYWFEILFEEQVKRLDRIALKKYKLNHLDEIAIEGGKAQI